MFPNNGNPGEGDTWNVTIRASRLVTLHQAIVIDNLNWDSGTIGGANSLTFGGVGSLWTTNGLKSVGLTAANVINNGTVTLSGNAVRAVVSGAGLTNNGTFYLTTPADSTPLANNFACFFLNNDTFTKSVGTGTSTLQWNFTNSGTLRVDTGTLALTGGYTQSGATAVTLLNGGNLNVSGNGLQLTDGTLAGTGSINGNVVGSGQGFDLAHGFSAGRLDITGNLILGGTNSVYFAEIGGFNPGNDFDLVTVTGTANLKGADQDLTVLNGFVNVLTGSEVFTILTATGGLGGTRFANAAYGFQPATSDGIGSFVVTSTANLVQTGQFTPISEPSLLALLMVPEGGSSVNPPAESAGLTAFTVTPPSSVRVGLPVYV